MCLQSIGVQLVVKHKQFIHGALQKELLNQRSGSMMSLETQGIHLIQKKLKLLRSIQRNRKNHHRLMEISFNDINCLIFIKFMYLIKYLFRYTINNILVLEKQLLSISLVSNLQVSQPDAFFLMPNPYLLFSMYSSLVNNLTSNLLSFSYHHQVNYLHSVCLLFQSYSNQMNSMVLHPPTLLHVTNASIYFLEIHFTDHLISLV